MTEIDPEFLKQLQEAFVIEAREQLQSFMTSVINMEGSSDEEEKLKLAEDILHDLHSIKGNSRAAGVSTVEAICQSLESALLSLRRKKELLKPEAADVFHNSIDLLDDLINKVEAGNTEYLPETFPEMLHRLKMLDERQRLAMEAAAALSASMLNPENAATAQIAATADSPAPAAIPLVPGPAEVRQAALVADPFVLPASSEASAPSEPSVPRNDQSQASKSGKTPSGGGEKNVSTRIALWKLDKLLRESEEMLILKQISEQHLEDIRDMKILSKIISADSLRLSNALAGTKAKGSVPLSEKELIAFSDTLKAFSKDLEQTLIAKMRRQQTEQRLCFNLVDGFIDSVKSLLMQDFTSLLSLVPKIVRDLSRELHKEVDLEIFGTDIEIDRRILEEIKDPVVHLVRNSLDHGIETSEERVAKGKPARASLKIGARQDESGNVQLVIIDDGKGINAEKLKAAAVKEGAITSEEAQRLSESEAIELMYRSSVSTSETVTEISGRGLGMAIVKERIHELGGRVLVETQLGKGTSFILQLPTKLSTFRGIQVMLGGLSFIVPTLNVHYAGRILRSEIKQTGSRNSVNINGQLTSVQGLADVLRLNTRKEFKSKAARSYQQLLVLESGDRIAGFLVDEIMHEHEVLVRGLSYPLVRVANVAGATILGSGQVVPVLNISDLLETSAKASWADEKLRKQLAEETQRGKKLSELPVFLVDQHLTSLVMLKAVLVSEGYAVHTFDSNETALEGLDSHEPLILLKSSDLSETQESGLAYWIRKDLRMKDLPIVFFGGYSKIDGEKFSTSVGGNAYFSKSDFDRKQLLELIERLT